MTYSSKKLEQLKQKILDNSNNLYSLEAVRKEKKEKQKELIERIEKKEDAMEELIKKIIFKNQISNQQERELMQDSLKKNDFKIQMLVEQHQKLHRFLTDTTALEEIYKTKKEQLITEEKELRELIFKDKKELENKKKELENIKKEIKDFNFFKRLKIIFIDYSIPFFLLGLFVFMILKLLNFFIF